MLHSHTRWGCCLSTARVLGNTHQAGRARGCPVALELPTTLLLSSGPSHKTLPQHVSKGPVFPTTQTHPRPLQDSGELQPDFSTAPQPPAYVCWQNTQHPPKHPHPPTTNTHPAPHPNRLYAFMLSKKWSPRPFSCTGNPLSPKAGSVELGTGIGFAP